RESRFQIQVGRSVLFRFNWRRRRFWLCLHIFSTVWTRRCRTTGARHRGRQESVLLVGEEVDRHHRHGTTPYDKGAFIDEEFRVVVRRGGGRVLALRGDPERNVQAGRFLGKEGEVLGSAGQLRGGDLAVSGALQSRRHIRYHVQTE